MFAYKMHIQQIHMPDRCLEQSACVAEEYSKVLLPMIWLPLSFKVSLCFLPCVAAPALLYILMILVIPVIMDPKHACNCDF